MSQCVMIPGVPVVEGRGRSVRRRPRHPRHRLTWQTLRLILEQVSRLHAMIASLTNFKRRQFRRRVNNFGVFAKLTTMTSVRRAEGERQI